MAPIEHLPDELLQEILLRLPRSDVKAARLTCTLLANNGAHHLFKRIYVAPRRKIMEDFRNITSHPVFGKSVKELVYDARLFIGREVDKGDRCKGPWSPCGEQPSVHVDGCLLKRPDASTPPGRAAPVARTYKEFYDEQEAILQNEEDLQTLCDGLERMPNISTLTLRDTFLYNDMDNPENTHGWYLWKTLDEFELVKVPSRRAMGDDMERNSIETTRSWDLRGVTNLYRALAHVDVKLLNFIAGGTDTQPLPLQTLTIPESPGPVLGSRLVSLNLMIEWTSVFGTRDNDGLFTDDLAIANCRSFLSSLKLLENLEVIGDWFDESEPWIMCFDGLHWPQLKQLELIGLTITRAQLLNLTLMHKSSLRELRMISICLIDRVADDGNWDFKTKELGKSLTLNGVSLCNLAEESDVPVIYGRPAVIEQNHVRLASNFMPEHPLSWSTEELYQEELYQEELHPNATVTNARRIDKTAATFQRNAISPD